MTYHHSLGNATDIVGPIPYTIQGQLQHDIPSQPRERIAIDIVGPLPYTIRGQI